MAKWFGVDRFLELPSEVHDLEIKSYLFEGRISTQSASYSKGQRG